MRNITLIFCSAWLFSCSAMNQGSSADTDKVEKQALVDKHQNHQVKTIEWLEYADPVADANIAADKGQFFLLAISSKGLSFPGIDLTIHNFDALVERCHYKMLATGGDAIYGKKQLQNLKAVTAYAKTYNQIALKGCLKQKEL